VKQLVILDEIPFSPLVIIVVVENLPSITFNNGLESPLAFLPSKQYLLSLTTK
jgi:hypothetical protein